jgi:hypothetical protein
MLPADFTAGVRYHPYYPMASECNWTNNNLACTNTWAFLRALKQLTAVFGDAGDLKMKDLDFWNPLESDDLRRASAEGLASQLDQMFILGLRAKYEPGFNRTKAVEAMTDELVQEKNTVCELSVVVDEAYQFTGEKM